MGFHELEYKYFADNVGLEDFITLMNKIGFEKQITVSSWDYYYTNNSDDFMRFRSGDFTPELTIKRKTKDSNNWVRIEVDLPLDPNRINRNIVEKFVKLEGYEKNFQIFKSCFIFFQKDLTYVYYIVYDSQMREKNRFIEVEVNKNIIKEVFWDPNTLSEITEGPLEILKSGEKNLEELGISSRNRLKKSLFEMFKK